jgi:preprotein translocase subunit SecG
MSFLYYLIIFLHVAACLFLIGVVLLQQGKGQDLASAFGGGGTQTAFGPRGSATVLSRATTILAAVFMVTSLGLSLVKPRAGGILDRVVPATPTPAASAAPRAVAPPASPAATAAPTNSTTPASTNPNPPAEAPKPAPSGTPVGK